MPLHGLFLFCAVLGGTIMILQLLFSLIGFGMDDIGDGVDLSVDGMDADVEIDGSAGGDFAEAGHNTMFVEFLKVISLKTLIAGIAFFGLGGLIGLSLGFSPFLASVLALIAGALALYFVYWIYKKINAAQSDGTVSAKSLIGAQGKVYLKVPGKRSGVGKVLINQQDRTMEYEAVTPGEAIFSGTEIIVTKIISSTTVEVGPA